MSKFIFAVLTLCALFPTWPIHAIERGEQAISFVQDKTNSLSGVIAYQNAL